MRKTVAPHNNRDWALDACLALGAIEVLSQIEDENTGADALESMHRSHHSLPESAVLYDWLEQSHSHLVFSLELETGRGDHLQRSNIEAAFFGVPDQNSLDRHLLSFVARGVEDTYTQKLVVSIAQRFVRRL